MATPTPDSTAISPISLLWAHQLRREHKALVGQITALETATDKAKTALRETNEKLAAANASAVGLERVVGDVRSEVAALKGEITAVRDTVDEFVKKEKKVNEERRRWESEMETERLAMRESRSLVDKLVEEVRVLREEVEELRRQAAKPKRSPETPSRSRYSTASVPPAAQPSPRQAKRARRTARVSSSIQGTPSSFHFRRVGRPPSLELIPESLSVRHSESSVAAVDVDLTQLSTMSPPASEYEPCPVAAEQEYLPEADRELDDAILALKQSDLSLSEYLESGELILARFARKRDEFRVVQALWEGLSDAGERKIIEEKLDKDGWSWSVVQAAVRGLIKRKEEETEKKRDQGRARALDDISKQGANETRKKHKRRRIIPIVWPTKEEEDEWRTQMEKWRLQA
ncbi:predicted protein [Uncinocarpus reesii 1704]|uniref:Uncharacterized protein n=1 Tax=Uncinocarpus reesii (strain UAMH 1704) TaxID=336963 RepID=C4JZU1_UNCRE|nr:uncharacterized protein UREG_07692 [Uncinocarpus reesii 1704]EEP82827.1 predicted protein [Uncinocarpus reesii 1704]